MLYKFFKKINKWLNKADHGLFKIEIVIYLTDKFKIMNL